ncbi:hypothetical protein BDQ17DRAFT_1333278 [Cyathus striatus]|nr:hypothetical protein BDQ17DRAFT_1333278 [Cyathus striatus]
MPDQHTIKNSSSKTRALQQVANSLGFSTSYVEKRAEDGVTWIVTCCAGFYEGTGKNVNLQTARDDAAIEARYNLLNSSSHCQAVNTAGISGLLPWIQHHARITATKKLDFKDPYLEIPSETSRKRLSWMVVCSWRDVSAPSYPTSALESNELRSTQLRLLLSAHYSTYLNSPVYYHRRLQVRTFWGTLPARRGMSAELGKGNSYSGLGTVLLMELKRMRKKGISGENMASMQVIENPNQIRFLPINRPEKDPFFNAFFYYPRRWDLCARIFELWWVERAAYNLAQVLSVVYRDDIRNCKISSDRTDELFACNT